MTTMKKLTISTRANGLRLKDANPNSKVMKYDSGKYEWHGSAKHYQGREEDVYPEILALWVERRTDCDGAYAQVMCLTTR
jgi:hypothetical protein